MHGAYVHAAYVDRTSIRTRPDVVLATVLLVHVRRLRFMYVIEPLSSQAAHY